MTYNNSEDEHFIDLFNSDDDSSTIEAEELKAKRLAEYETKKSSKPPKPPAKSMVTLEIKPWDDETDLKKLLSSVKSIAMDGLVWGSHSWVPVGFGIEKLQINLVIEDDKVSLIELQASIEDDVDICVQSTDVVAMQKL